MRAPTHDALPALIVPPAPSLTGTVGRWRAGLVAAAGERTTEARPAAARAPAGDGATELLEPLRAMARLAACLRGTELSAEQRTYARALGAAAEAALAHASRSAGVPDVETERLADPGALVEDAVELAAERAAAKGVAATVLVRADVPADAVMDDVAWRQAVGLLVERAVRDTDEGGVMVTLRAAHVDGGPGLRLQVMDTGPGTRATDAILARVPEHVDDLDGRLRVEARRGAGTTVTLDVPLPVATRSEPGAWPELAGALVLVLEDHGPTREALAHHLSAWGARVRTASGLADAAGELLVARSEGSPVAALLIGAGFGGDGALTSEILGEDPLARDVARLLVAPFGAAPDAAARRRAGLESVVLRPVRRAELAIAMRRALLAGVRVHLAARARRPATLEAAVERWLGGPVHTWLAANDDAAPAEVEASPPAAAPAAAPDVMAAMRDLVGIDDPDFLQRLVSTFLASAAERLGAIRAAVARGDAQAAADEAHGLRGGALHVGAEALARIAGQIEELGDAGRLPPATLLGWLDRELALVREGLGWAEEPAEAAERAA